jgi:hypothetical protein
VFEWGSLCILEGISIEKTFSMNPYV